MNNIILSSILISIGLFALLYFSSRIVIFSSTKAQITQHNTPIKNAIVLRRYEWQDKSYEDQTTTDQDGFFTFPSKYAHSIVRLLPIEIVIGQKLLVKVDGKEKTFWTNSKRGAEEGSEFFNTQLNKQVALTCELTKEENLTQDFGSITKTVCTW